MKDYGLDKFHKRLIKEARIKSVMSGAIIGLLAMISLSIIFYFTKFNGLWISLVVGLFTTSLATFLFRKYTYKTSLKITARKLDALGLEERVVTMLDYAHDDHMISKVQRKTAEEKLVKVPTKSLKFTKLVKLTVTLSILLVLAILSLTISTVEAHQKDNPPIVQIPDEKSEEDKLIEKMIEDLRRIVNQANVSQLLKDDLHMLIDDLEQKVKLDDTLNKKIARIEETRRLILERIALEQADKTTLIDELITHESTHELGVSLETKDETVISNYINELIDNFLTLSIEEMKSFVEEFEIDIETSIEDSDIKNPSLEQNLRDLVELLKSLIPIVEGDIPEDVSDEVDELVEDIMESIGQETPEDELEEDIDEIIQDVVDELVGDDPEDPEDPEDPVDPGDGSGDGEGDDEPLPIENPKIIDGQTDFDSEAYLAMLEQLLELFESNQITDEELIEMINNYMRSIEIKQNGENND